MCKPFDKSKKAELKKIAYEFGSNQILTWLVFSSFLKEMKSVVKHSTIELAAKFLLSLTTPNEKNIDLERFYRAIELFQKLDSSQEYDLVKEADQNLIFHKLALKNIRGNHYPEQTEGLIKSVFYSFKDKIKELIGIDHLKSIEIINFISKIQKENFQKFIGDGDENLFSSLTNNWKKLAPTRLQIQQAASILDNEFDSFVGAFCLSHENAKSIKETEIRNYPIFLLDKDKFLLVNKSHAYDVMWERLEQVLLSDSNYADKFKNERGKWLENKTLEIFKKIFPENCVYHPLFYSNPDKQGSAELDFLVLWKYFLILAEVKSGEIRWKSIFDLEKHVKEKSASTTLKRSIKKTLKNGWEQATRAYRYIKDNDEISLSIGGDGRLNLKSTDFLKIGMLTMTLRPILSFVADVEQLKNMHLLDEENYPIISNIFDLEAIAEKCRQSLEIFISYLIMRNKILKNDSMQYHVLDELDLFQNFLSRNLHAINSKENEAVFVTFDDFADSDFRSIKRATFEFPNEIVKIQEELTKRKEDICDYINTIFHTFDLTELSTFAAKFSSIRGAYLPENQYRICALKYESYFLIISKMKYISHYEVNQILSQEFEKYSNDKSLEIICFVIKDGSDLFFENIYYLSNYKMIKKLL